MDNDRDSASRSFHALKPARGSTGQFEGKSFQILRFWNRGDNRMIKRLSIDCGASQDSVRIKGSSSHNVLKRDSVDMVRTAKRRQCARGFEQLQSAEMNLLVAPEGIRNRSAIARKRGRIKNDQIEARNHFFMRGCSSLRFQPVKYIGRFERALVPEP